MHVVEKRKNRCEAVYKSDANAGGELGNNLMWLKRRQNLNTFRDYPVL